MWAKPRIFKVNAGDTYTVVTIIVHLYQHMHVTEIKSHTQACTLLHISPIQSPCSVRSKFKGIHTANTLISYVQYYVQDI